MIVFGLASVVACTVVLHGVEDMYMIFHRKREMKIGEEERNREKGRERGGRYCGYHHHLRTSAHLAHHHSTHHHHDRSSLRPHPLRRPFLFVVACEISCLEGGCLPTMDSE